MNNEQLRQRAKQIADEYGNDAYSVALTMLEQLETAERIVLGDLNKIKAEAAQDFIELFSDPEATSETMYNWLKREADKYASKLESQK